jgi:type I restriction enzyme M protein
VAGVINDSVLTDIDKLETDLWSVAANLRADSKLPSGDYFMLPVGGVFLRYAKSRFEAHTRQIAKTKTKPAGRMASPSADDDVVLEHCCRPLAERFQVSTDGGDFGVEQGGSQP